MHLDRVDNLFARIDGSDAHDLLSGDAGDDIVFGHGGDDLLVGFGGVNHLFGGDGDDIFVTWQDNSTDPLVQGMAGSDRIHGGDGFDTTLLNYDPATTDGEPTWSVDTDAEEVVVLVVDVDGGVG